MANEYRIGLFCIEVTIGFIGKPKPRKLFVLGKFKSLIKLHDLLLNKPNPGDFPGYGWIDGLTGHANWLRAETFVFNWTLET